jgi:hypothetical protein
MAKKSIMVPVPCLTVKQLIDALAAQMTDQDPVMIVRDVSDKWPALLSIYKIERIKGEEHTFEITGELCLPKGWVYMTGIFKGNPWETLKGEITYEEE